MSGASGKVPAVIHVGPEALAGGPLARVRDGDVIRVDALAGTLDLVGDAATQADFAGRVPAAAPVDEFTRFSMGRGLFGLFRRHARAAEEGAARWTCPKPMLWHPLSKRRPPSHNRRAVRRRSRQSFRFSCVLFRGARQHALHPGSTFAPHRRGRRLPTRMATPSDT